MSIDHEMRIRNLEESLKSQPEKFELPDIQGILTKVKESEVRISNLEAAVKKLISMQGGGSRRSKE